MPDLTFTVDRAETVPFAATPMISFRLNVSNSPASEKIHSIALRTQVLIEVTRRRYADEEQANLRDLFGDPDRWSQTLRTMLWTHISSVVTAFEGQTSVEIQIPCTFDFNVAATKYFYGLQAGEIPLLLQFSGSVFYENGESGLSVVPISWDKETKFRLPVTTWRDTIDAYYPNTAWLCLRRDVFDRIYQYKIRHGIPTWEQALESILSASEEMVRS